MKLIVGISGASGAVYAKRLLDFLAERAKSDTTLRVALTASENGLRIFSEETKAKISDYPFPFFKNHDFDAPFASGSAGWDALVVAPCSGGTLGKIASGVSPDLMCRCADVMLKERKKAILVFREAPYGLIHIRNMETVTLAGGLIIPASPAFYAGADTVEALADTVVARVLDHLGLKHSLMKPWGERG